MVRRDIEGAVEPGVHIRLMKPGEEDQVSRLILDSFREFVGCDYSTEGRAEFQCYAEAQALRNRAAREHFSLVATIGQEIAGVIEIRRSEHISLLFVDKRHHQRGVARKLFEAAIAEGRKRKPTLHRVTVHSSRYAVPVYQKLGMRQTGPEQSVNGILFIPMQLELQTDQS